MQTKEKQGLDVLMYHKGVDQPSRIFCDRIEYIHYKEGKILHHHLLFWNKGGLAFKIWLKNGPKNKAYNDVYSVLKNGPKNKARGIYKVLKDVGIEVIK